MIGKIFTKANQRSFTNVLLQFNQKRELHSRNRKAREFIGKGWSALKEVDRVIVGAEIEDIRLLPLLRVAKENFELALEADNTNTQARYYLALVHLNYHTLGACNAVGTALLIEAAEMGHKDAQYVLGCKLRERTLYNQTNAKAFYYINKAADQLHTGALYLLGIAYLTGDWVKKDVALALLYFHKASAKGHAGAAIAYGSLLLKGVEVPECITKLSTSKVPFFRQLRSDEETLPMDRLDMAKEQFEIAVRSGCNLGLKWLEIVEEKKKHLQSGISQNGDSVETSIAATNE